MKQNITRIHTLTIALAVLAGTQCLGMTKSLGMTKKKPFPVELWGDFDTEGTKIFEKKRILHKCALFSDYFNDIELSGKTLCMSEFSKYSKETLYNYRDLIFLALTKKNVLNRFVLLTILAEKLEDLYHPVDESDTILDLYDLAQYTKTNIIRNAIALYFVRNNSLVKSLLHDNSFEMFRKEIGLLMAAYKQKGTMLTSYIKLGILPIITFVPNSKNQDSSNTNDLYANNLLSNAFSFEPLITRKDMTNSITFKKMDNKTKKYVTRCLRLAPNHIAYKRLHRDEQLVIMHKINTLISRIPEKGGKFVAFFESLLPGTSLYYVTLRALYEKMQSLLLARTLKNAINESLPLWLCNAQNDSLRFLGCYFYYIIQGELYKKSSYYFNIPTVWKQIFDAVRSNNNTLDLGNLKHEVHDKNIAQILMLVAIALPNIKTLLLHGNTLTVFPTRFFSELKKIEKINLRGSSIKNIEEITKKIIWLHPNIQILRNYTYDELFSVSNYAY